MAKTSSKALLEVGQVEHLSRAAKPSALVDTRVIYCGDNLDQLRKLA